MDAAARTAEPSDRHARRTCVVRLRPSQTRPGSAKPHSNVRANVGGSFHADGMAPRRFLRLKFRLIARISHSNVRANVGALTRLRNGLCVAGPGVRARV